MNEAIEPSTPDDAHYTVALNGVGYFEIRGTDEFVQRNMEKVSELFGGELKLVREKAIADGMAPEEFDRIAREELDRVETEMKSYLKTSKK